jgi:hypothetical protein
MVKQLNEIWQPANKKIILLKKEADYEHTQFQRQGPPIWP